jgi:hypothetical protein
MKTPTQAFTVQRVTKILNKRITINRFLRLVEGKYEDDAGTTIRATLKRKKVAGRFGRYTVRQIVKAVALNLPGIIKQEQIKPATLDLCHSSKLPEIKYM